MNIFLKSSLYLFLIFLLSKSIYAQKVYDGIAVTNNDKPIEGVEIRIDGVTNAITDLNGNFKVHLKKGYDIKYVETEAVKQGFELSSFRLIDGKIKIVLIEKGIILKGKILDHNENAISGADVYIKGDQKNKTQSNHRGIFSLNISNNISIGSNTSFMVNEKTIPASGLSFKNQNKFVTITLPEADAKQIIAKQKKEDKQYKFKLISEEGKLLTRKKIIVNGKTYQTDFNGEVEVKMQSFAGSKVKVENYEITKLDSGGVRDIRVFVKANSDNTEQAITFTHELIAQRQALAKRSAELAGKVEGLINKYNSGNISEKEKKAIEIQLAKIETEIQQHELDFIANQEKTHDLIAQMRTAISFKDSINSLSSETIAQIKKEKDAIAQAKNDLELAKQKEQEEFRQNFIILSIIILCLLILAITFFFMVNRIRKQKVELMITKKELEHKVEEIEVQSENLKNLNKNISIKNKKITDSIRYAKNIQTAILPSENTLKNAFSSYFTLYYPKDIVSGDFYWCSHIKDEETGIEKTFIAAVDCTGHGVPGAFMSMIGNSLLNEIVNEKKIYDTEKVLEELDSGVKLALKQKETSNDDGMDVCLCAIEKIGGNVQLSFSGAKRPLFHISAASGELQVIKGDKRSIGGSIVKNVPFTKKIIKTQKGDKIYLTSDGLIDQNDISRRKLGSARVRELLKNTANQTLEEQKIEVEKILEDYKEGVEQRDDITLIGIEV
ncbi:PP2C family protein-serine/threonine phosphatase [Flexithrix dorotheae]|uniref:PP2C family protein-serine/threonine phosphatase n=1 Tax=Flexithrix dorotheae TaxID=70993 RepID=UPI00036E1D5B|nr:SpoIIE family protein phosphatase [Flexithrix dorotheae]